MTTHVPAGKSERLLFLDSLRGIAALLVVFAHALEFSESTRIYADYIGSLNFGAFGVAGVASFFFVSGYIIPLSIERAGSQRRFWINRAFRIYPLYLTVFAITFLWIGFNSIKSQNELLLVIVAHMLFIQEYLHIKNFVSGSWTLFIELIWYFSVAILFAIGGLNRLGRLTAFAVAISFASIVFSMFIAALPLGRISMLLACLAGMVHYRYDEGLLTRNIYRINTYALYLAIVTNIVVRSLVKDSWNATALAWNLSPWVLAIVLFELFHSSWARSKSFGRTLPFLGKISYSLYLVHGVVLLLLADLNLVGLSYIILLFLISIPLSILTYNWIEVPAIRYSGSIVNTERKRLAEN